MRQIGNFGGSTTSGDATKETIIKYKTARQTVTSSVTHVDDNHLSAALSANKTYHFEMELFISAPTSGGFKYTVSSNQTLSGSDCNVTGATLTAMALGGNIVGGSSSVITITTANNSVRFNGYIVTGASAPTVTLRWAQNTSNATGTYIEVNSWMKFTEV